MNKEELDMPYLVLEIKPLDVKEHFAYQIMTTREMLEDMEYDPDKCMDKEISDIHNEYGDYVMETYSTHYVLPITTLDFNKLVCLKLDYEFRWGKLVEERLI